MHIVIVVLLTGQWVILDSASKTAQIAIELKPKYASAFSNRGNAYQAQGNLENAIEDYDKADST